MATPAPQPPPTARAWAGCALVVLGAVVLLAGMLVIDSDATWELAIVVVPAAALAS